ncbi:MAG: hypothetical protein KBG83_00170 [Bacteroidetes bacterium]|nr:hypothetical protein [Bacteroidota bacterium]
MGILKVIVKDVLIAQHDSDEEPVWTSATSLGDLKGKPFVKVTWDQETIETQNGKKALGLTGKFETSTFAIGDSTVLSSLQAMRGENVSLKCVPAGTIGADNPAILIKNFSLLLSGEINLGGESLIKLSGEKPSYDEDEIFDFITSAS